MANQADRWYFNKETIRNSPSTRDGVEHAKELGYRQQCANLIQDIGQRLQVNQLVINTAIVYMHRFYMFHSFQKMHRNVMAACFIFLAAKVEEMPRKLEHILKASHRCLNDKETPTLDNKSDEYMQLSADLVNNESVLLQTLGFEVTVDHPNTYVVKCAQLVKASKELAQTAYFLATNSLHLTTFCIQYKPTVVACVCIYVACLWANYVIPETEGKNWYEFIENTTTKKQLDDLSSYFIKILDSSPTRLKKRLTSGGAVVYKDGKVVQKKDEASTSSSTSSHSETSTAKKHEPPVKNTLISHLKAHSHEATPPPSSHRSSHHHTKSNTNTPVNSSKTAEQLKLDRVKQKLTPEQWEEYKRKRMTPEQLEAYKKYKERERQIYLKKKAEAALNATKSAQKTAADPLRKSNNDEASPMKRARIDSSSHHSSNHSSTNHHSSNHHHTLNHHQNHMKQPHHTNHNRLNAATTTTTTQKHSTKPYKSNGNIINSKLQHLPPHPPELNF